MNHGIFNATDNEAKKLLSNDLTSAESKEEVKNWMIIAIVVSVVSVRKILKNTPGHTCQSYILINQNYPGLFLLAVGP